MYRAYKYRLYPNKTQIKNLNFLIEQGRLLYNAALQERKWAWDHHGISITYQDQAKQLKNIRPDDPNGLGKLNHTACQQTLHRLDEAFKAFFRRCKRGEKPGYPRFKGRGWFSSLRFAYGDGLKLRGNKLYIQNVGLVRLFQHRPIPTDAVIKQAVVKRNKLDHWHVIFQIELPDSEFIPNGKPAAGIDMGLEYFATLSTGEQIQNPRWFRKNEEKLVIKQRRHSQTKKGSRQNKELRRQIAKEHQHIANQRRDFQHKLSHRLVNEFGFLIIEDLNILGLYQSFVSKSMRGAAWSQFLRFLDYKASNAGCQVSKVDPKYTSQTCPRCDSVVKKSLSDRIHDCSHCGYIVPRDVAAAQVILKRGKARTEPLHKRFPTCRVAGN